MAKRNVEAEVDAVSALRDISPERAAPRLRDALSDRVNLVAAKAAKITAELQLRQLLPDLLGAFDRLFVKPVERDPQCWAKNAIAQALVDLDYREHAPFLMGARHVQMEAVWNGQEDTAQTLRGICLLALVSCNDIPRAEIFRVLVDAMVDKAQVVRVEAVRAVAEMEGEEASLLLRLKARMGDKEPAVTGQVFDSMLRLEPARALPLVKGYLEEWSAGIEGRGGAGAGGVEKRGGGRYLVGDPAARGGALLSEDGVARVGSIAAGEGYRVPARVGRGRGFGFAGREGGAGAV